MNVVVIGAGVVGCSTAYHLCCLGYTVTLIDSAKRAGMGTSYANGGQLSYAFVEPFASSAIWQSLPKLLLNKQSSARFELKLDYRQWLWGAQFLAACTHAQAAKGTEQLLAITALSRDTLSQWMAQDHLSFDFKENGKLLLCADEVAMRQQSAQIALQAPLLGQHGVIQNLLSRETCIAIEPALEHYPAFVGGVWTASECAGDAHQYCQTLLTAASQRGLKQVFNQTVERIALNSQGQAIAVVCQDGSHIACDAVIVATGLHAPQLAKQLGDNLPIYPIKGYSITVPFKGAERPKVNVTDLAKKTVFAPIGGQLRVAAVGELSGYDCKIPAFRLEQMVGAVNSLYPDLCDFSELQPWSGLRPATPTSVPIVRASRVSNVIYNVGHGGLGFTLAAGCAILAQQCLPKP